MNTDNERRFGDAWLERMTADDNALATRRADTFLPARIPTGSLSVAPIQERDALPHGMGLRRPELANAERVDNDPAPFIRAMSQGMSTTGAWAWLTDDH